VRRTQTSNTFKCAQCGFMVDRNPYGTRHRNHCPYCLWSKHVDESPGDRRSDCGSRMEPLSIGVRDDEWVVIHRCLGCGMLKSNRVAGDDNAAHLLSLAARPLARPPFPLDRLPAW
jgi:RNHCP domain